MRALASGFLGFRAFGFLGFRALGLFGFLALRALGFPPPFSGLLTGGLEVDTLFATERVRERERERALGFGGLGFA